MEVKLPVGNAPLVFVDLWKGICYREEETWQAGFQGTEPQGADVQGPGTPGSFILRLAPRETLLVLPWQQPVDGLEGLQTRSQGWYDRPCPDWTGRFQKTEEGENRKTYVYRATPEDLAPGQTGFQVRGQEMVECYCNGRFVEVSFWGVHRFDLAGHLLDGENEIRLVVTGNGANIYNQAGIWFGLEQEG